MESTLLDPTQKPEIFKTAYGNQRRENVNWVRAYQGYDAAIDWPTAAFFDTLYKLNPDAKVILTVRDFEKWYQSILKTIVEWPNVNETWPSQIVNARNMARVVVRNGELKDVKNREVLYQKFVSHIAHVKQLVKPENLLILEVGEGWEKLCRFLGKDVPSVPYPHCNKGNDFPMLLNKVKSMIELNDQEKMEEFINRMEDTYA
jgi:hypothetical protein